MKLKLFIIVFSIIILNLIFIYNKNRNFFLKNYFIVEICELDIEINQDPKLNFFLRDKFKYNKNKLDNFYKNILYSYINEKKYKKNYIEELLDKEEQKFAFSRFLVNEQNHKIFFKYSPLNTDFYIKDYLIKILKKDIDNNIKFWSYLILEKNIDLNLEKIQYELEQFDKSLNYLNININKKLLTRENHRYFINSKNYKNIYLLKNIKCNKYDPTSNIFFSLNFNLLFFFIIYLLLHNKKN